MSGLSGPLFFVDSSLKSAIPNIEERLTEFKEEFQQKRQSAITGELLEIIAGFELNRG